MKLRTKLTVFSILLVAVAVAACCALILSFVRTRTMRTVTETGLADYRSFSNSFRQSIANELPESAIIRRSYLLRAFRSVEGFQEFSLKLDGAYISNNAGFDIERLLVDNASALTAGEDNLQEKIATVSGRSYYIAHATLPIGTERYDLSFARDISTVTDEIRTLAVQCMIVGLCVTALAAFGMRMLVYRAMRPVERLRKGAGELALGNYDSRILIRGRDELSELAADFNSMADAIEANIFALNEKSARQQAFINDLSHEMKTPVTSILLSAETLLDRSVPADTLNRSLNRIYNQGKWLELLSQKLMTLVMLQQKPELKPERVTDLLNAVAESVAAPLQERGIRLSTACGIDTLPMEFDLMHSALVNLVINAANASTEGQTVELRAYDRVIEVIDQGKGIPPEEIDRIREPFYRIDRSRNRKNGGAGLGLALVSRIVEAHGANLVIQSDVGRGTTVRIEFNQPEETITN